MHDAASIVFSEENKILILSGNWRIGSLHALEEAIYHVPVKEVAAINGEAIIAMDTAGAYLLFKLQQKFNQISSIDHLNESFQSLLDLIKNKYIELQSKKVARVQHNFFYRIGEKTIRELSQLLLFLGFLGEIVVNGIAGVIRPLSLQWRSLINEVDVSGYRALPIIAVMMTLIGVVVAYQLGVQLKTYAANVYVVDFSGIAILREFSPLIVSVIIAGRTSTSFAALIGTMKVNEEIDALRTMGLSPIERIVLPRIFGLLVALPLLVVWGDVFGMLGSMVMAKGMMGISFDAFLERFQQEVAIKHLYLGLVKTPIFALIIAGIGCYQGFEAEGSAESVGRRTTIAAVQSIFLIILADGIFSILFNWLDL